MKQNTYDTEIDTQLFSNVKENTIETYYKHANNDYYLHQQDYVWKIEENEHDGITYKTSVRDVTDERITAVNTDDLITLLAKPVTVHVANYQGDILDHPVEIYSDGLNVTYALHDNIMTMKNDKEKIIESTKHIVSTFIYKLRGKPIPYGSSKGAISILGNVV